MKITKISNIIIFKLLSFSDLNFDINIFYIFKYLNIYYSIYLKLFNF